MAEKALFPEEQSIQLAIALANLPLAHVISRAEQRWVRVLKGKARHPTVQRAYFGNHKDADQALAVIQIACEDLIDEDTVSETTAAEWLMWGRSVREWLLVARRQKYGVRLRKSDPRARLPAFPPKDEYGRLVWLQRKKADARGQRLRGFEHYSVRTLKVAASITAKLENLKPFYLLFCWQTDSELTIRRHGALKPITAAAFGAALLLDSSSGYTGSNGRFFSYKARFGMCQRPGCRKFYCFGQGTKGADHKHCSTACADSHRVWLFRHLSPQQKANRAALKKKGRSARDAQTRMGRLAQIYSGKILGRRTESSPRTASVALQQFVKSRAGG